MIDTLTKTHVLSNVRIIKAQVFDWPFSNIIRSQNK